MWSGGKKQSHCKSRAFFASQKAPTENEIEPNPERIPSLKIQKSGSFG